ncbi:hypothetical protein SAMN02745166_01753 [Prosthecobacter debontii]|uniref:Uncharacterized protein n=1 Tax=Prosthecobacter debontii TaxID=48467 RepID=A0A1T4XP36_9BACT|nr:hypothetical protein SAMN02745166_01753 [Prosthecobacter debontii]
MSLRERSFENSEAVKPGDSHRLKSLWLYGGIFILSILPVLIWALVQLCGHTWLQDKLTSRPRGPHEKNALPEPIIKTS